MKARYYLLVCLALAACDAQEPQVIVNFAQPFPAKAADLPGFLPRHRRRYAMPGNLGRSRIIGESVLLESHLDSSNFSGAYLDSIGIPRRTGRGAHGLQYEVRALPADSFRVRVEAHDTLLNLSSYHMYKLRRYHGWYYLSLPAAEDPTKWEVQRLRISNGQVVRQLFNPDSLRVLVLAPIIIQRRHYRGKLIITLAPQSRQADNQVSSYDGLWLDVEGYIIGRLGDSNPETSR